MPGGQSRWSAGKDLSWEPLRVERVCEVKYDHLQGDRFRHAAVFLRWRADKPPADCRYDQLEVTPPAELARDLPPRRWRDPAPRVVVGIERLLAPAAAAPGTCSRLTRTRVQVDERPRIESTSTSAASSCAAASGWRAFQRSSPASASSFFAARPISMSGFVDTRRPARPRPLAPRRLHARRLARLLGVVRRPRRVAQALRLLPGRELEQRLERAGLLVDPACRSPIAAKRAGIVRSVNSSGRHSTSSSQVTGAETRASGFGRTE